MLEGESVGLLGDLTGQEHVHNGVDDNEDDNVQDRGDGDLPESLVAGCALDLGDLIHAGADGLQRCQEHQRLYTGAGDDVEDVLHKLDDGIEVSHGDGGVADQHSGHEAFGKEAAGLQRVGAGGDGHHVGDDVQTQNDGQEEDHTHDGTALELAVGQQRQEQRQQGDQRHVDEHVGVLIHQHAQDLRLGGGHLGGEQIDVVLDAVGGEDHVAYFINGDLVEGVLEGLKQGLGKEHEEAKQEGDQECEAQQLALG